MNVESRVTLGRGVVAVAALALLCAGAGVMYLLMRPAEVATYETSIIPAPDPAPSAGAAGASAGDVVVTLTPDAVERAGLMTATVATGASAKIGRAHVC